MAEKIRVNITITADVHEWYKQAAENVGMSMSTLMALNLREAMRKTIEQKREEL